MKFVSSFLFISLFFVPILTFFGKIESVSAPHWSVWSGPLVWSFFHSAASATIALVLGFWGALGLSGVQSLKAKWVWQSLAMLPGFLPQIVVLTSLMSTAALFGGEVRGLSWLIWVHALLNVGICAVAIDSLFQSQGGPLLSLCRVEGASPTRFLVFVFFPVFKKQIFAIWLLVFCFCLTSFGVPLIVADARWSFEVLLFDVVKTQGLWSQGLFLGGLQILLVFGFSMFVFRRGSQPGPLSSPSLVGYPSKAGLAMLGFLSAVSVLGLVNGWAAVESLKFAFTNLDFQQELLQSVFGTLKISAMSFFMTYTLLMLSSGLIDSPFLHRFFVSFLPPSTVLFGFGLWMLFSNEPPAPYLKIALGLSLLFFPALYRWKAGPIFQSLKSQWEVAEVLGANRWTILNRVVWPQCQPVFFWLSGVAAFWASGDFALSSILSFGTQSLGILNESLVGSYRFELATLVSFVTLVVGFSFFAIGSWLGHVTRTRS